MTNDETNISGETVTNAVGGTASLRPLLLGGSTSSKSTPRNHLDRRSEHRVPRASEHRSLMRYQGLALL